MNWNGDFQIGTASDDELLGLSIDLEGSVYYTGYEHGNVHITNITPAGNATMVVRKLDKSGALVWDKALDTPGTDTGESLVVDPSGDKLYVVGRTSGAFPGFSNQGQFDIVVAMMNSSSGDVVDLVQNGSERPQHPRQIAMNGQNELVVGGFDDTYVPIVAVIDWENSLLAKYSICEQKTLTPSLYLQSNSIYTDFLTGIVADGSSLYASGAIGAGPDEGGTFVQQFDADGAPGWKYVFSTISVDYTTAIALSPDGDLYATGASFLTLGDESFGQQDMFLAKFDKMTGSLVWMAQAGTSESDWPTAIGFDLAGNVYVAGSTLGSFPGYQNQGEDDLFMLTFDSAGALTSTWQKGSPAWDNLSGMVVDACGNVLLGGFTAGSLLPGASHLGGRDMFLLKVE